jgi:hypothetical protein
MTLTCPFCGGKDFQVVKHNSGYSAQCQKCKATGPDVCSAAQATAWVPMNFESLPPAVEMVSNMSKVVLCPGCGEKGAGWWRIRSYNGGYMWCVFCGVRGPLTPCLSFKEGHRDYAPALDTWNRRVKVVSE